MKALDLAAGKHSAPRLRSSTSPSPLPSRELPAATNRQSHHNIPPSVPAPTRGARVLLHHILSQPPTCPPNQATESYLRVLFQAHQACCPQGLLVCRREQLLPGHLRLQCDAGGGGARQVGRWARLAAPPAAQQSGPAPAASGLLSYRSHIPTAGQCSRPPKAQPSAPNLLTWRKKMSTAPSPVPCSFFSSART